MFALPGQTIATRGGRRRVLGAPVAGGLGPELIVNGGFDGDGAPWNTEGEPVILRDGAATFAAGYFRQTFAAPLPGGGIARLTLDRLALSSGGQVVVAIGDQPPTVIPAGSGPFEVDLTVGLTPAFLEFDDYAGSETGAIDNVSLRLRP